MTNVFVVTPGRTASMTFANACSRIVNYSAAHESRARFLGSERFSYPKDHIEIDNRLIWFLPLLKDKFGANAKLVYLFRDPDKVAESYHKRWNNPESIVRAYGEGILMHGTVDSSRRLAICRDYAYRVDEIARTFVRSNGGIIVNLDSIESDFVFFLDWIDADCEKYDCLSVFQEVFNQNSARPKRGSFKKIPQKIARICSEFPDWISRV